MDTRVQRVCPEGELQGCSESTAPEGPATGRRRSTDAIHVLTVFASEAKQSIDIQEMDCFASLAKTGFCKVVDLIYSRLKPLLRRGLQVVLLTEFFDEFQLGLQPIDMFLLGFQDRVEDVAADKILVRFAIGDGCLQVG